MVLNLYLSLSWWFSPCPTMLGLLKILLLDSDGRTVVSVLSFFFFTHIFPNILLNFFPFLSEYLLQEFSKENILRSHLPVTILYFDRSRCLPVMGRGGMGLPTVGSYSHASVLWTPSGSRRHRLPAAPEHCTFWNSGSPLLPTLRVSAHHLSILVYALVSVFLSLPQPIRTRTRSNLVTVCPQPAEECPNICG